MTLVEGLAAPPEHLDPELRLLVARSGLSTGLVESALDLLQVREHEFGRDDVDVPNRIDRAGDVDDVVVLEATDHLHDRVHLSDVREELVAETLALARARDESGDVDETQRGGNDLLGRDQRLDAGKARIRNWNHADVRLDGAEGVVLGLDARRRQGVEQGALADIGQADDAAFHELRPPRRGAASNVRARPQARRFSDGAGIVADPDGESSGR
jgi:hypothetical protein